nr:hypothetical protein CFP56_79551 [Quercus suber]
MLAPGFFDQAEQELRKVVSYHGRPRVKRSVEAGGPQRDSRRWRVMATSSRLHTSEAIPNPATAYGDRA